MDLTEIGCKSLLLMPMKMNYNCKNLCQLDEEKSTKEAKIEFYVTKLT